MTLRAQATQNLIGNISNNGSAFPNGRLRISGWEIRGHKAIFDTISLQ